MAARDIVVIGASAGGVEPLKELIERLPSNLPAAVFVVLHTSSGSAGRLPAILARAAQVIVASARDGARVEHGRVLIAPPDHHLLLKEDRVEVTRGPHENGFRPAVDPLFRTAAIAYGERVVGVILSGSLDDGTHGLKLIKRHGGIAIVQTPEEALIDGMPRSAIKAVAVDYVVPVAEIAALLPVLATRPIGKPTGSSARKKIHDPAEAGTAALRTGELGKGSASGLTCPACNGALWELSEGTLTRFRCHVGHVFTTETLLNQKTQEIEYALWSAVRVLEEHAGLQRRMAHRARKSELAGFAQQCEGQAHAAELRADVIRQLLVTDLEPAIPTLSPASRTDRVRRKTAKPAPRQRKPRATRDS